MIKHFLPGMVKDTTLLHESLFCQENHLPSCSMLTHGTFISHSCYLGFPECLNMREKKMLDSAFLIHCHIKWCSHQVKTLDDLPKISLYEIFIHCLKVFPLQIMCLKSKCFFLTCEHFLYNQTVAILKTQIKTWNLFQ